MPTTPSAPPISWLQWIGWRAAFQNRIHVDKAFVQMLPSRSMSAATMLSRLVDLYAAGDPTLRPVVRAGGVWWPLPWSWWTREVCLSESTGRRAARVLEAAGLIRTRVVQLRGTRRCLCFALDTENLLKRWVDVVGTKLAGNGQSDRFNDAP